MPGMATVPIASQTKQKQKQKQQIRGSQCGGYEEFNLLG
jgi:hypothetical protein